EQRQLLFASHALAIGWIHHHDARGCRCAELEDVRALQRHPALDARFGQVAQRSVERLRIEIAPVEAQLRLRSLPLALAHPRPGLWIERAQLFKPERALRAGRAPAGYGGSLDQQRAAAAHGIDERHLGTPA